MLRIRVRSLEEAHLGGEHPDQARKLERLRSQVAELTTERDIFKRAAALLVQAEA